MKPRPYADIQPAEAAESSASARRAVQISLDRRDNGGDARASDSE